MGSESPNVILYDVNGQEMSVSNGASIPAGTSALMIAGSDGTNSRFITLDTSGRTVAVGAGVAGTPAGGVVSIQGVQGGVAVSVQPTAATSTSVTSVAASASNVELLASNTNRLGATIWNESTTATLYLKMGITASITSYTAQVFPSGYFELPYGYTGEVDGIWSAAVGNARITEVT